MKMRWPIAAMIGLFGLSSHADASTFTLLGNVGKPAT